MYICAYLYIFQPSTTPHFENVCLTQTKPLSFSEFTVSRRRNPYFLGCQIWTVGAGVLRGRALITCACAQNLRGQKWGGTHLHGSSGSTGIHRICTKWRSARQVGPSLTHAPGARMTWVTLTPSNYYYYSLYAAMLATCSHMWPCIRCMQLHAAIFTICGYMHSYSLYTVISTYMRLYSQYAAICIHIWRLYS